MQEEIRDLRKKTLTKMDELVSELKYLHEIHHSLDNLLRVVKIKYKKPNWDKLLKWK